MTNTTKHQCEISCSSPITYPSIYMTHLPKQIKLFLFTFPDYYHYTIVDVLPEHTLNWMPCYTEHKYKGAHQYACVYVSSAGPVDWMPNHILHRNMYTYHLCMFWWVIRLFFQGMPYYTQVQGCSPLCMRWCFFRLLFWMNAILHTAQV